MPQLYLPAAHTDADLVLASQIAARIDSAELHVAWSPERGQVVPEVSAVLREPAVQWTDAVSLVLGVVREIWLALFSRDDRGAIPPAPAAKPAADEPQPKPAS